MTTEELLYRRQFVVARAPIPALGNWQSAPIGKFYLYAHKDLAVTIIRDGSRTAVLLGYMFDVEKADASNSQIVQALVSEAKDFSTLLLRLKRHPGRYALLYHDSSSLRIVHDALGLREVYFCERENKVICASQPGLLQAFADPPIPKSSDPDLLEFVENHFPYVRDGRLWVGDGTAYAHVKHLLPNHYLDVESLSARRYWPNEPLKELSLQEGVERSANFLKGAIKAAASRQPLMLAVTAGLDSRSLLAASREIAPSVYFFINQHARLSDHAPDIRIPKMLLERLGLPFHIHQIEQTVPAEFRSAFLKNAEYAKEILLPVIYNIYYKRHPEKLNVLGVGEVGRTKFGDEPRNVTPYYLAYMLKYRKSRFAVLESEKWLQEARPAARQYGLNIMTLFWWEVLIGNWGAVGNSESDIAIEEFDPYASHFIYETFLSVHPRYRTFRNNILFRELIRHMWPELLEVPDNPPHGLTDWRDLILSRLGIEAIVRRLKFKVSEFRYRTHWEPIAREKTRSKLAGTGEAVGV